MIDEKTVIKRFERIKALAKNTYGCGDFERSIGYIRYACQYMYENNVVFHDDDIEQIGVDIAKNSNVEEYNPTDTILFYQYYPMDTRGLAYIYLKALVNIGIRFIWVTYKSYNTNEQTKLCNMIESSENGKLVTIDDTENSMSVIEEWHRLMHEFRPRWALFISCPWDVESVSAVGCYKGVQKILVNGTDHTFWYGATVFDKILEFRNWGKKITIEQRGISENKLIKFPYYPTPSGEEFKGFPFKCDAHNRIVTSGGSLYKIYGSDEYFQLIKYILSKHKDCIFYYMGNGDKEPLLKYIRANSLEDRFYISDERKDFDEVIKNSYIYLNTYPLIGALMVQYAVANGTVPVGLNSKGDSCNDVSELFIKDGISNLSSLEDLYKEIDKLLDDERYYLEKKQQLKNLLLQEPEFSSCLKRILEGTFNGFEFGESNVVLEELRKPYLLRQNKYKAFWLYHAKIAVIKYPRLKKIVNILRYKKNDNAK